MNNNSIKDRNGYPSYPYHGGQQINVWLIQTIGHSIEEVHKYIDIEEGELNGLLEVPFQFLFKT